MNTMLKNGMNKGDKGCGIICGVGGFRLGLEDGTVCRLHQIIHSQLRMVMIILLR